MAKVDGCGPRYASCVKSGRSAQRAEYEVGDSFGSGIEFSGLETGFGAAFAVARATAMRDSGLRVWVARVELSWICGTRGAGRGGKGGKLGSGLLRVPKA